MTYIALKPCRFAGQDFRIGDTVPGALVLQGQAENLVKMKILARAESETIVIPSPVLSISVNVDGSDLRLEPSEEGIQDVFSVLTSQAADAEAIVKKMDDSDALILLHMSDSRKTIKAAAEKRAKEISPETSEGEQ